MKKGDSCLCISHPWWTMSFFFAANPHTHTSFLQIIFEIVKYSTVQIDDEDNNNDDDSSWFSQV